MLEQSSLQLVTICRFVERLNGVRAELNILDGDIKAETARFSEDIKYFAEFTTGELMIV